MSKIEGGIPITSFISPTDSSDTFATHDSQYGKGGWKEVDSLDDRDNIPLDRRKEGMSVYVISEKKIYILYGGIDNSKWEPAEIGNSSSDRISFGNINTNDLTDPPTLSSTIDSRYGDRFFPHIKNEYSEYNKFLFDIKTDNGWESNGNKFPSKTDMVNYLDENLPRSNFGNSIIPFSINCYARKTDKISINKIYGMNLFYSILKGSKNYKKSSVKTLYDGKYLDPDSKFDVNNFIKTVWDYFTYSGFIGDDKLENGAKSIWFATSFSNIYALYNTGHILKSIIISGNRNVFCWGDSDFKKFQAGWDMRVVSSIVMGLTPGTGNFYRLDNSGKISDNLFYSNISLIKVYYLQGIDNYGDSINSILIKPIGQDTFRLNYVGDLSDKDLYAIYYEGDNNHQPMVKRLSGATKVENIISDISFLVNKNDWCVSPYIGNSQIIKHIGNTRMKRIRFFIGDQNGNISNFSPEISPYILRNGAKQINLISYL